VEIAPVVGLLIGEDGGLNLVTACLTFHEDNSTNGCAEVNDCTGRFARNTDPTDRFPEALAKRFRFYILPRHDEFEVGPEKVKKRCCLCYSMRGEAYRFLRRGVVVCCCLTEIKEGSRTSAQGRERASHLASS